MKTNKNKFTIVLKYELLYRIRQKAFWIMSLVGPIIFIGFILLIGFFSVGMGKSKHKIVIIDSQNIFDLQIQNIDFVKLNTTVIPDTLYTSKAYDGILIVPENLKEPFTFYQLKPSAAPILPTLKEKLERWRLAKLIETISPQIAESISTQVLKVEIISPGNALYINSIRMALATIGSVLIYMFMFMYPSMAMRAVAVEKTNKVVEVILTSVKPFDLMLGKLLAIMIIAILQFLLWIALFVMPFFVLPLDNISYLKDSGFIGILQQIKVAFNQVKIWDWLLIFAIYFILGYLLYGAMFEAIGAMVGIDTDSQYFMLPITIPLILPIVLMQNLLSAPDGSLAIWLSIIPFTSPITMVLRVSFGIGEVVSWWELAISIALLILTILAIIWMAGKIFRGAIMLTGTKITLKDLWKWIKS